MVVGVLWWGERRTIGVRREGGYRIFASVPHVKAVLYKCDPQACTGSVLGSMSRVEEVGEKKADKRKGHGYHGVPDEREQGADREAVHVDFVGCRSQMAWG